MTFFILTSRLDWQMTGNIIDKYTQKVYHTIYVILNNFKGKY
jgi:hypothetical protein